MQKPFLIVYKMNLLNYLLYRPQVKIPYIGMVNIVAGKEIVPEYLQFNAKPEMIARAALGFLQNPPQTKQMLEDLSAVKTSLGTPGAAERAAKLIIDFLINNKAN
jgi:lipid-A-disaccharide synthase